MFLFGVLIVKKFFLRDLIGGICFIRWFELECVIVFLMVIFLFLVIIVMILFVVILVFVKLLVML